MKLTAESSAIPFIFIMVSIGVNKIDEVGKGYCRYHRCKQARETPAHH